MYLEIILDKLIENYKEVVEEYRQIVGENEENVLDYEEAMRINHLNGLLEAYDNVRNWLREELEKHITLEGFHKECESYGNCIIRCSAKYQGEEYELIFAEDGHLTPLIELYDKVLEDYVEIDVSEINGSFIEVVELLFNANYFDKIPKDTDLD